MWSLREETNLSRLLSFDYFCIADGDPIIKPGFYGISKCLPEQECMSERQESGSSQSSHIDFHGMFFDLTNYRIHIGIFNIALYMINCSINPLALCPTPYTTRPLPHVSSKI
jgi:hypothetical protein